MARNKKRRAQGARMISAPRLKVLRVIELSGEMDCASIAQKTGTSRKVVATHVRALLAQGYLTERLEELEGRGPKFRRYVSRSEQDLPPEIENVLDNDWWPPADAIAQQALHRMVSVGRMAA